MTNALTEVKPFVYTSPQGLQLEVLFVLDPEKKGYINATAIAKQFEKKPDDWLRNQHTQAYIEELLNDMNQSRSANPLNTTKSSACSNSLIPFQIGNSRSGTKSDTCDNSLNLFRSANSQTGTKSDTYGKSLIPFVYEDLVVTVNGGPLGNYGTWLHPKLAVIFARWMSAHFAVWCDKKIAELLHQHPEYQKQFPELSAIFEKLEESQRQFKEVNQRLGALEQHIGESINTTAQMLNRFHTQAAQDNKQVFGQIFNSINQINKVLHRQQADLLNPNVEVTIQQTLTDYQHSLEQMLQQMFHGQQDELIQGYLIGIKDNLERIEQRLVAEPVTVTEPVTQPVIAPVNLATEIAAFKEQGWSWNRIAQELNARGTPTVSGIGQWHGSSVKRYLESHAAG